MSKHAIVISQDAMVYEDLELLKRLPNFSAIWDKTACVKHARSVYPSLTYPAHVSMMTGVYPDRHGVTNNEQPLLCEASSKWICFRDWVNASTIFDHAKAKGLSTAAVFWPVTGNDPSIDYLIDEYGPQTDGETPLECLLYSGSSKEVACKVIEPNLHHWNWRNHPDAEKFVFGCAAAMIREFKPNLLMIHPANIDAYRHETGLFSEKVTHGLHEFDGWFGDIVKAAKDAGIYAETDFFILSDHGQLNICRSVSPNVLLAEHGLIQVDASGAVANYLAFCKSSGLSSQVYLKDPRDKEVYDKTYTLLCQMCDEGVYGISHVYTAEEARREERLAGSFSFVLETDGYSSFTNEWVRPIVRMLDVSDYRFGHATHGHQPDKGPQPTMFAFGPSIMPGVTVERCSIVDEPLTVARALGFDMPDTDGKPIDVLLR